MHDTPPRPDSTTIVHSEELQVRRLLLPVGHVGRPLAGDLPVPLVLVTPGNLRCGLRDAAMLVFRRWAESAGLRPIKTVYVSWSRDRRRLRFSKSGDPGIERACRTPLVTAEARREH